MIKRTFVVQVVKGKGLHFKKVKNKKNFFEKQNNQIIENGKNGMKLNLKIKLITQVD